jgi:hypothetical protein
MGTAPQTVDVLLARPSVFGDDLAPPRQIYFGVIPAVLVFFGMLSWMLGDDAGWVLACVVASVVGLYTLWGWLFRKAPTRFSTILAMALLLGYGGGALNTWATLPRGRMSVAAAMGMDAGVLARGIAVVLLATALLYCFGEIFEKPVFGREFHFSIDPRTRALVYAGTLAMLAGFATHAMGFQGATTVEGHLNPVGAFLSWLYIPLTAIAVAAFLTAPERRAKVLCGVASGVLLLMLAILGRRIALYTAVEILLVLRFTSYRWRSGAVRKILVVAGLGAVIIATSLMFMLLRIAGWSAFNSKQVTVTKRLELAHKMVQRGNAYALATSRTTGNLQTRTFVLGFLSSVLEGSSRTRPAFGEDVIKEAENAIPSFLYPDKDRYFSEEQLVDQQFGYSFADEANSILTAGGTDFGLLGAIIYPLLLVIFMRIIYDIVAKFFGVVPLMFIALSLIYIFLQTEINLGGYFGEVRVIFFFGLILAGFMAFPSIRLKSDPN